MATLMTNKSLHAIMRVHVFSQIIPSGELRFAAHTLALEDAWCVGLVSLQVFPETIRPFQPVSTMAACEEIKCVHVALVRPQNAIGFARVRAVSDVTFERSLVRMLANFVFTQHVIFGKTYAAFVALESLNVLVGPFNVFPEVFDIFEQLSAFPVETPDESRRAYLVSRHVKIVTNACFQDLAAQQAIVNNGAVHSFRVQVHIARNLRRVRAARNVACVHPRSRVAPHVLLQVGLFGENFAA
jgi:tartrate dehydratase beta subunit/fumarate hydratase class I family protein